MTATIKPPDREVKSRPRSIRFVAMESLGFSNPSSVWSDTPSTEAPEAASSTEPDTLADWQPQDFGGRLDGANFRWSLLVVFLIFLAAAAAVGYWLYQRPNVQAEASVAAVTEDAEVLSRALIDLEVFNSALIGDEDADTAQLFGADTAARELFQTSGELPSSESNTRSLAAAAASATLDGVRLAGDGQSYRLAVGPILATPDLETDPNVIELDEAARTFGEWQLRFDEVRTALPDGVLPDVTEQLDVLSGDLTMVLREYVDALREDEGLAAEAVVASLSARLQGIAEELAVAVEETSARVGERIAEARSALGSLLP